MRNLTFTFLVLIFVSTLVKAQKAAYYPQVPFDSVDAKSRLALGKSTIEGTAFTRLKNGYGMKVGSKILAKNVEVTLYPVTSYFEEWFNLRKKMENKKNSVYMSEQAFRYRITIKTDDYGRFKFTQMKPGKYFIQSFASYSRSGSVPVYRGSGYNSYGGRTDYYDYQSYTNNYSDRVEEFVEVTRDGQAIEIKLH
ncbi:hypothetical protein GCM10022289_46460 [Pedobacter jeongneungensis]|uniref:Carboxypeptidase regulatory-like domain-containing protein n=1 Tax=Pedobacter jeongneungensis TaxID=947309 RepID=A0ABP8BQL5_9SPHI